MRPGYHSYRRRRPTVLIAFCAAVCFLTVCSLVLGVASSPFRWEPTPSDAEPNSVDSSNIIQVIVFTKNADKKAEVLDNLLETLRSIFRHASIFVHVHILTNCQSFNGISGALLKLEEETDIYFKYTLHHLERIEHNERTMVRMLRKYFFTELVTKYDDDIFFLTPGFHRILPDIERAIFLDTDLRFRGDIRELWNLLSDFADGNAIGIAHDLQPMYRDKFGAYREKHPGTDVGSPNPGKQGFNTGVMLMDFNRMRTSLQYNLNFFESKLQSLRNKYEFSGDLGHQDFYTLLGMEYPELFYILNCTWNRQLEMTWSTKVPRALFDEYHKCEGEIKVYHANAGSELPPDMLT